MPKTYSRAIHLMTVLLLVVNFSITMLSPRFGYAFDGVNSNLQKDAFTYQTTQTGALGRKDIYQNAEGTTMSLEYSARFLGERTWVYDDELPETGTVRFDGGIRNPSNPSENTLASFSRYDIMRYDSGGFFFLPYLLPVVLVLLSRTLILKQQLLFKICAVGSVIASILISTRITTFLALV